MGIVKMADVRGGYLNGGQIKDDQVTAYTENIVIYCKDCLDESDRIDELEESGFIMGTDVQRAIDNEEPLYCNLCGEKLEA